MNPELYGFLKEREGLYIDLKRTFKTEKQYDLLSQLLYVDDQIMRRITGDIKGANSLIQKVLNEGKDVSKDLKEHNESK